MSRKSMSSLAASLLVALAALLAVPGTANAAASDIGATTFNSNGDAIAGWNWVRNTGQQASWTFDLEGLADARARSAYLNVSGLVTNGTNGGSGYSASSVKFQATCETGSQLLLVKMVNPFRPTDPQDSAGLGYAAYGASSSPLNLPKFEGCTTLTVTAAFPYTAGRHIAFKQESLTIGYSK